MEQEPQPWEFRSKPSWQRLIIMLGGVTVNFILAAVIYIFMAFSYGDSDIDAKSIKDGYLITNPLLIEFGLQTGDNITAINGQEIAKYSDLKRNLLSAQLVSFERDGVPMTATFPEDFLGQLSSSKSRSFFELRQPFVVASVAETSLNKGQDLQQGDLLTGIDGNSFKYFDEFEALAANYKGQTVNVTILRGGKTLTKALQIDADGKLGLIKGANYSTIEALGYYTVVENSYTFGESYRCWFGPFYVSNFVILDAVKTYFLAEHRGL